MENYINLNSIEWTAQDYPHPRAFALIVRTAGCVNDCISCFVPDLKNQNNGKKTSVEDFERIIEQKALEHKTYNLVFQGGDILYCEESRQFLKEFCKRNRNKYNICVYTGCRLFWVKEWFTESEERPHIWKIGPYAYKESRKSYKDDERFVLSSSNQDFYTGNFKKMSKDGILYFDNSFTAKIKRLFSKGE